MAENTLSYIALVAFYLHVAISYAVLLNPCLYMFERSILGFYKIEASDEEKGDAPSFKSQEDGSPEVAHRPMSTRRSVARVSTGSANVRRSFGVSSMAEIH